MGFSAFEEGLNSEKKKTYDEARKNRNEGVVKLINPNYGRVVTLQVTGGEPFLHMAINILTAGADGKNIEAKVSGNIVTLTFSDDILAEKFRSSWKN